MSQTTLQPPDTHHLSAAVGWLGLGNTTEAIQDLMRISPEMLLHPDVLEVTWQIHAKSKNWEGCIEVASELTIVAPKNPFGWIHLSFALHELKRTTEAQDNLIGVLEQFPDDWLMRYNLACYACQLGNLDEAQRWLANAALKGDGKEIQRMAKADPDLTPLFRK